MQTSNLTDKEIQILIDSLVHRAINVSKRARDKDGKAADDILAALQDEQVLRAYRKEKARQRDHHSIVY
jgi:hypothetical protein